MHSIFIFFLFYEIILIQAPIPNWDLNGQSIQIPSDNKITYENSDYGINVKLERKIQIENGVVIVKNYLTVNSYEREVPFEDIDSHYSNVFGFNNEVLICPKGKFHPYKFNANEYFKPDEFKEIENWDLKCYNHFTGHLLILYLPNGEYTFYSLCPGCQNNEGLKKFNDLSNIYDFNLENKDNNNPIDYQNYQYMFPSLKKDVNQLNLHGYTLEMNLNDGSIQYRETAGNHFIIDTKKYTNAYFHKYNNNYDYDIYYFTYNDISDFQSGFYQATITTSNNDYKNNNNAINIYQFQQNSNSPLSFTDNVEIIEMNFIKKTSYVYYKLYNLDKNTYYYGLIDIKANKVQYNIEQNENITFIPYSDSNSEMLLISSSSINKICIIKDSTSCDNTCSNIVFDPNANLCQSECIEGKINLMPDEICIIENECDTSLYIIKTVNEKKQCGLCSYFNSNDYKYKFVGGNNCLDVKPNHSIYYNQVLSLLKCEENYNLLNDECKPNYCYETCATCTEVPNNINDQKCSTCKSNYILDNGKGNCIPILTECKNKRCKECSQLSDEVELCISCDETKHKKVNYTLNQFSDFFDCKSLEELQFNFYYDEISQQYKPCYEYCKRCLGPGNVTNHNCLECNINYMFRPGYNPFNNCVVYSEFYYLSAYNEYKPLNSPQCPEEAKFSVKEDNNKISCIYDCKNHTDNKFLYNGYCVKSCDEIEGTTNENSICKENDINKIYISKNPFYSNENDTLFAIQTLAKSYAEEFDYTVNHISVYKNEEMTVALYKNMSIISDTDLILPRIDFKESYNKIKSAYNITDNLIIAIVEKKVNNNPKTFYSFFHPVSGIKLEVGELCINDNIEVKENLLSMLDEKSENYELQKSLTKQGINIFDLNDPYYKDICYDFYNPKNKDMALKDRIKETYVNVTLCDKGCFNTGIDVKNNIATCNCKFNDVTNNDLIHENAALEYLVGEFFELINSSNILVLKCYKNLFKHFTRSIGGMLVLSLLILNIFFTLIFFFFELIRMKRYIFNLTEKFSSFVSNYPHLVKFGPPKRKEQKNKTERTKKNENNKLEKSNKRNTVFTSNIMTHDKLKNQMNSKNLIIFNNKVNSNSNILANEKYKSDLIENENVNNELDEGKKLKKYFKEYLSTSLDDMEYDDAIKLDNRAFCRYLIDCIELKQSFAYTFISSDPINTRMIKLILFSLNITLYFVVDGLFFNEEFISELYHTEDKDENFFSFIKRTIDKIIYTTIVAIFIGYLMDFFFLDEKKIKGIFKREKENKVALKRSIALLIKEIQNRYISFIIMTFVILLFSLYYVLCFNFVYPKTQIEWIKSSILIIIVMQLISILKCLYETIFRFLSFKCESEKLYKVSKFFT